MFELSQIVTPVDHSSASHAAFVVSTHLAELYKAQVHSTHVVAEMPAAVHRVLFPYAALGEDIGEFERELVDAAQHDINAHLGAGANGAPHPTSVVYGNVVDSLMRVLLRVGPDLVVMGAYGESGLRPRQLGSICARLLDSWSGPVLLVRETSTNRPFGRVIAATDLGPGSEALLGAAAGLAIRSGNPLSIVTVIDDPRIHDSAGLTRGVLKVDPDGMLTKGRRNAERQFKRLAQAIEVPFPHQEAFKALAPKLEVLFGDPVESLREQVSQIDDALLVLGRAQKGGDSLGLGRTAEAIVRRVPAHALVIPL